MMDETYLMEHIKDQLCFVSQVHIRFCVGWFEEQQTAMEGKLDTG